MRPSFRLTMAIGVVLATTTIARADCGIDAGSVRILSNDFEALQIVATAAEECASPTVTVTKNQTTEHENLQVPALTTNPATYTVAVVANSSILPLLNNGLIRPMDDLVEKYGQNIDETQLIRIDGKVMAIAFMSNAQHLWFRQDILDQIGVPAPTSYEDVLAAAQMIRDQGIMQTPLAASFKPGWDLAEEFVNMYLGMGGEFFAPGTAELAIDNDQGRQALEMMKSLSGYMSPDFVTYNTNELSSLWKDGQVAMMNGWGSRTGAAIDPAGPAPDIAANTGFASAPTVGGGSIPAATLWWDGFAIAANISDEDAEASFQAMMHALAPETAQRNPTAATWLIKGYEPTAAAAGVIATVQAGAKPYPMVPYMGLLHTALGDNLAEFMQGQEGADQALKDVGLAYETAAREAGFLQ
ncbi:MAG: extracellular solute-binding protein [Paracoccaceae bacterium]